MNHFYLSFNIAINYILALHECNGANLCHALDQCRWAKNVGEPQGKSQPAINGGKIVRESL